MKRFVRPTYDIVFKSLWLKGNADVRRYLIRMVEFSIGKKIDEYELGNNESGILSLRSIANKFDILLVNNKVRSRINVEMNRSVNGITSIYQTYNKNDTYLGHMLSDFYNGLDRKNRYKDQISIYQVNFNCFYAPEGRLIHRLDFEFVDKNFGITRKGISSHQIYLPRMRDLCYDENEETNDIYKDFTLLLADSFESMKSLAEGNKERLAVIEFLEKLGKDDEVMSYIDREEFEMALRETEMEEMKENAIKEGLNQGIEQGMAQGIEKGMAQGIEKGMAQGIEKGMAQGIEKGMAQGIKQGVSNNTIEIAKKMLNENLDIELISKITNLSIKEINELK